MSLTKYLSIELIIPLPYIQPNLKTSLCFKFIYNQNSGNITQWFWLNPQNIYQDITNLNINYNSSPPLNIYIIY